MNMEDGLHQAPHCHDGEYVGRIIQKIREWNKHVVSINAYDAAGCLPGEANAASVGRITPPIAPNRSRIVGGRKSRMRLSATKILERGWAHVHDPSIPEVLTMSPKESIIPLQGQTGETSERRMRWELAGFPVKQKRDVGMKILLTNDDGIFSEGLAALYEALASIHRIDVVAPDRERSAVGHGITLNQPLRAMSVELSGGLKGYAVNGTPADCVKLSLRELLEDPPDFVISGINPGANVGINAHYSGTVAAAREAALNGIRAMAVSVDSHGKSDYRDVVRFVLKLLETSRDFDFENGKFLNINFPLVPSDRIRGVRITRQANVQLIDGFERRIDPRNRIYYWPKAVRLNGNADIDQDVVAIEQGYISITPMICDMTDYSGLERIAQCCCRYPLEAFDA